MSASDPSYKVGRGKPPKDTQFSPGNSGNPKGRPKGSKNFATTIQGELRRRIVVNENGRRKKISKREAVAKQLVNSAAAGNPKSMPVLLNEARRYEERPDSTPQEALSGHDAVVAANIIKRIRMASPPPATSSSEATPATEFSLGETVDGNGE